MKSLYSFRERYYTQDVVVCEDHARGMPAVDGTSVTARPCDHDIECEFCDGGAR